MVPVPIMVVAQPDIAVGAVLIVTEQSPVKVWRLEVTGIGNPVSEITTVCVWVTLFPLLSVKVHVMV